MISIVISTVYCYNRYSILLQAAILGCAFVALLLGSLGVLVIICHAYHRYQSNTIMLRYLLISFHFLNRSRHFKEESRKRRAVQLYDSIVVKSQLGSGMKADIINMPGEAAGTMSKAMSYDVNPVNETGNK